MLNYFSFGSKNSKESKRSKLSDGFPNELFELNATLIKEKDSNFYIIDINEDILNDFSAIIKTYKDVIAIASSTKRFNCEYKLKKSQDDCQVASGFMTDNASKYLKYYLDLINESKDLNITLQELNSRDNIKKIISK